MATHGCQNTVIVCDFNQQLVHRAFTELTVVNGVINHVNIHGSSLDPVLINLPNDLVQHYQLNRFGSSDHNTVFCELVLNTAYEEGS